MKKNLYFRTVEHRRNVLSTAILDLAYKLSSYPKLILECILRSNMGERYYNAASAITLSVVLAIYPIVFRDGFFATLFGGRSMFFREQSPSFLSQYGTWYLFLACFAYCAFRRWQEVKRNPSVFDFHRYSLYTGDIQLRALWSILPFRFPSIRIIEIYIEPAIFFVIGYILSKLGQPIGTLLVTCSIMYALSYAYAYKRGSDFVLDRIDEKIMNEEMENAFVNDEHGDNYRGVRFYTRKPSERLLRKKLAETFIEDDRNNERISVAE